MKQNPTVVVGVVIGVTLYVAFLRAIIGWMGVEKVTGEPAAPTPR